MSQKTSPFPVASALSWIDDNCEQALEELKDWLRLASISTDPDRMDDCAAAARWIANALARTSSKAEIVETRTHPIVFAQSTWDTTSDDVPRVLFYGHYDVQPVDPVQDWSGDPFEPWFGLVDGSPAIFARGASDDKGQAHCFLLACRAMLATGRPLPFKATFLFEGEEENGGTSGRDFIRHHAAELRADFMATCDSGMSEPGKPLIKHAARGMIYEEVRITGARHDLHSGGYGGVAANPIHELSRILSALVGPNGEVNLHGFYDGIDELSHEERLRSREMAPGLSFLEEVGLVEPIGDPRRPLREKLQSWPSWDVTGIFGGYAGEGMKMIIPSEAGAKISFRLVDGQNPEAIVEGLRQFFQDRLGKNFSVRFKTHVAVGAAWCPPDGPYMRAAAEALEDEWGAPAEVIGLSGSLPILAEFTEVLHLPTLMIGFGLPSDSVHGPDENLQIESYRRGARSWVRILEACARKGC